MIQKKSDKTSYAEGLDLIKMREMQREMTDTGHDGLWRSFGDFLSKNKKTSLKTPESTGVERRDFMKIMGASMSLAGLTACNKQPTEKIVPYVDAPEEMIPGVPLFFASLMPFNGLSHGILVESHMGRPNKIEGNKKHPSSLGGSDSFAQASILQMFDPDRSKSVLHNGRSSNWAGFIQEINARLAAAGTGKGLHVLLEAHSSPTLNAQIAEFKTTYPDAEISYFDAVGRENIAAASKSAFGKDLSPVYQFDKAETIFSLDADFLASRPDNVRYIKDFANTRDLTGGKEKLSRLYVAETAFSPTGASSDTRIAATPSEIEAIARTLAKELGLEVNLAEVHLNEAQTKAVKVAAKDLRASKGKSVIVAGETQAPIVHVIAAAINKKLASKAVSYIDSPVKGSVNSLADLSSLVKKLNDKAVKTLFIVGANPVYSAPASIGFVEAVKLAETVVHVGLYADETAAVANWHIPQTHFLEAWSDGLAYDGSAAIAQPLIDPLYSGKSVHDVFALLTGSTDSAYDIIRKTWMADKGEAGFETFWRTALHDGAIVDSAPTGSNPAVKQDLLNKPMVKVAGGDLEISLGADPTIFDGRYANNAWLQELPKPITTLTWDNAILMGSQTALDLGVIEKPEDINVFGIKKFTEGTQERWMNPAEHPLATITVGENSVTGPILVVPGHAEGAVSLSLGYGRERAGVVGNGIGFDVSSIRSAANSWAAVGSIEISETDYPLALTQDHQVMEGRGLVRSATLAQYVSAKDFASKLGHSFPDGYNMYAKSNDPVHGVHNLGRYQWGMVIDMNRCTSCNACMIACQAENNITVVGKSEVLNGREMHWLRMDRYFEGDLYSDSATVITQPVACVHCELAPCETVCPVGATVHSNEGLNQMVYNRCIGTRYCANNCPYKVRRFNYYQYGDLDENTTVMANNPDVTIRVRGVMEKCTYCVQRINHERIDAKKKAKNNEDYIIHDGSIVTACQQACPAEAITFGDIRDEQTKISKLRSDDLNYLLLGELNTRPRTSYLARVTNPSEELVPFEELHFHGHHAAHHGSDHGEGHDSHAGDGHKADKHAKESDKHGEDH